MKTYEKYLTEVGLNPHTGDTIDYTGEKIMKAGDKKEAKKKLKQLHIVPLVKRMSGLVDQLLKLEKDLKFGDYKEWKKLSSINKKYKKFNDNFIDTYFSRH